MEAASSLRHLLTSMKSSLSIRENGREESLMGRVAKSSQTVLFIRAALRMGRRMA